MKGKCAICGEDRYAALDVHRWKTEGKDGGEYTEMNSIVVCGNHHKLIHAGTIKIIGVFESTSGQVVIFEDENGEEKVNPI